ncbi:MAG TPA: tetratricopeptide repeat protein, partial [Pirellulaceae bacterium]|nr:tetratricopeptide repeat protein [Pirellulaceae bacterium]
DAAAQYRLALKQLQARPQESLNVTQIWIELARCSVAEQAQRPVWKRDWRQYDEAAAQVRQRLSDSPLPMFIDLQVARLAGDSAKLRECEDRIAEAKSKFVEAPGFWEELAGVRLESGEFDEALEAIEQWEKLAGATAHRFRGDLAAAAGDQAAAQEHWATAAASLPTHRQRELLSRRVEAAVRAGDVPTAAKLLDEWRAKHPSDRQTAYQSAQLAWNSGDAELLEKAASDLKQTDGENSRASLFAQVQVAFLRAAQRIAVEPESAECTAAKQRLEQAVATLVARRSDDRQARSLQALAAELLGQPREAIKAWRQTLALGEQSPDLKLRLAKLLHDQGQSREALELC